MLKLYLCLRHSFFAQSLMFQMLSCFDLKTGEDIDVLQSAYAAFVDEMQNANLVKNTQPIGHCQRDTPMDTGHERDHEYFVVMSCAIGHK